jgi:hypothetical protein
MMTPEQRIEQGETVVYKNVEYLSEHLSYGYLIMRQNGYEVTTNCFYKIEKVKKGGVK